MKFEQTILDFADAYQLNMELVRSRGASRANSFSAISSGANTPSGTSTPALSRGASGASSRADSFVGVARPAVGSFGADTARRPSFASRLQNMLAMSTLHEGRSDDFALSDIPEATVGLDENEKAALKNQVQMDVEAAWELESDGIDRGVRILPGVKDMISSLPEGRYAVATSGAKTYGTLSLPRSHLRDLF